MGDKTILVIGTYDTKDPEMRFIEEHIRNQGADVLTMDVSVLGDPTTPTDISKHDVANAGGKTIDEVIALGDEAKAYRVMSKGAAAVVAKTYSEVRFRRHAGNRWHPWDRSCLGLCASLADGRTKIHRFDRQLFPPDPTAPAGP